MNENLSHRQHHLSLVMDDYFCNNGVFYIPNARVITLWIIIIKILRNEMYLEKKKICTLNVAVFM